MRRISDDQARRLYLRLERGRHHKSARRLLKLGGAALVYWRQQGCQTSGLFVSWGAAYAAAVDRGGVDPLPWRDGLKLRKRFWRWYTRRVMHWGLWYLRRKFPGAAGWNDFYMLRWFMTGRDEFLRECFRRACEIPGPESSAEDRGRAVSARWMLSSLRTRVADLDAALSVLEAETGVPLVMPDASAWFGGPAAPARCPECGCWLSSVDAEFTEPDPPCTKGGNCVCHRLGAVAGGAVPGFGDGEGAPA